MGAKFIFPVAVSPYRIPEPALGIAKLGAAYVSKPNGKFGGQEREGAEEY
jgi:hypothetical protein